MAINKRVSKKTEDFILEGGEVAADKEKNEFQNVLVRLPLNMVEAIERKIKEKPWMTRTGWIAEAIHGHLCREE